MVLAELIDEAKFPNGVFNLINGDGATTGSYWKNEKYVADC
jgi:aldehyde dehydrogenase (NAD+)